MYRLFKFVVAVALIMAVLPGTLWQPMTQGQTAARPLIETTLTDFVPAWAKEGGPSAMLKRMADPDLRGQIETEINDIVSQRVNSAADIFLPQLGDSVGSWMAAFDRETNFDYELEAGQALWSFVNLNYDTGNTVYVDEFTVYDLEQDTVAFHYDFSGADGALWDPQAFGADLFVAPKNPPAVRYTIENNTGKMEVDPRRQGTASSYGKLTPIMDDLASSEVVMRFRVDMVGLTQYLRVWIQSDKFGSGSSFAANGYGIALHLGRDELTLQRREDGSTTALQAVKAHMTTDWHWLKLRAADGKISVKLWNDNNDEPEAWNIQYAIPAVSKKAMVSAVNLDWEAENTLHIHTFQVGSPTTDDQIVFQHDFTGADGAAWDTQAFGHLRFAGATTHIQHNTGRLHMEKRSDMLNAPYATIVPHMPDPMDSDLLLRFRVDQLGRDQRLRAFVRADAFYDGNTTPKNGYGIEFDLKTNQLTMIKMENQNMYHVAHTTVTMTTDWHWLRLRLVGDDLAVRLWPDGQAEPDGWHLTATVPPRVSAGEAIMRLLALRGDATAVY